MKGLKLLLLNELVHKGKLEEYRKELYEIIEYIRLNGCEISTTYIDNRSSSIASKTHSERTMIRLSLQDNRGDPLSLIWDLLHEFGHHKSGLMKDNDTEIEREKLAWEYAELELAKHP